MFGAGLLLLGAGLLTPPPARPQVSRASQWIQFGTPESLWTKSEACGRCRSCSAV